MQITMTFDSLEEFQSYVHMKAFTGRPEPKVEKPAKLEPVAAAERPVEEPEKPQEAPEEPKTVKSTPKDETPKETATAAPKADRVTVRRILSELNKKTGDNTAHGLIVSLGFEKLTFVPDDRLAELQALAEEAMKNAE